MPLDPNNPATPVDESLETWRTKNVENTAKAAEAATRQAAAVELLAQSSSGEPVSEGGIFLRILCAVLGGRLVGSSADAQIWATDLTRDYLVKYNLDGSRKP